MKRTILTFTLAVLTLAAATAQQRLVRLTRYEGHPITGVSASAGFDVYLVQSAETKAVVEISGALEEYLDLSLGADGIVRVSIDAGRRGGMSGITHRNTVRKLTVYLPTLTLLEGSGVADFYTSGTFRSRQATIRLRGGADLESLNIQADVLHVNVSGGADAGLSGRADALELHVSGGADAELNVNCNTAQIRVSGGADVELRGAAEQATFRVSGGGEIKAHQFSVKKATVSASSAGSAAVWASDELSATASSAASIRYRGNPRVLENRSSSAASIRRMD